MTYDESRESGYQTGCYEGERWQPAAEYEGIYEASDLGRVRAVRTGQILAVTFNRFTGYCHVSLSKFCKNRKVRLHILIAKSFLGPLPALHEVNHKDTDKTNCRLSNLEYLTKSQNMRHAVAAGRVKVGENSTSAKLTEANARDVFRLHAGGMTLREIGKVFGVSHTPIRRILIGKTWRHLGMAPATSEGGAA